MGREGTHFLETLTLSCKLFRKRNRHEKATGQARGINSRWITSAAPDRQRRSDPLPDPTVTTVRATHPPCSLIATGGRRD